MKTPASGLIGPNSLIQAAAALRDHFGQASCQHVFQVAGLSHYLDDAPGSMVHENEVMALHRAMTEVLGVATASTIAADAGKRTADYLLANRIPAIAQCLLSWLPFPIAAAMLCRAIARHSWTFAGSGVFAYSTGRRIGLSLTGGPLAAALPVRAVSACYFAGTFHSVFSGTLRRPLHLETAGIGGTGPIQDSLAPGFRCELYPER